MPLRLQLPGSGVMRMSGSVREYSCASEGEENAALYNMVRAVHAALSAAWLHAQLGGCGQAGASLLIRTDTQGGHRSVLRRATWRALCISKRRCLLTPSCQRGRHLHVPGRWRGERRAEQCQACRQFRVLTSPDRFHSFPAGLLLRGAGAEAGECPQE